MDGEKRAKIVVGKREMDILRVLIENGGCIEGMLNLINKAYGNRWHTRNYFRAITRRIYRMEEKGLMMITRAGGKNRGRKRKTICITPYGVRAYYSRL